MKIRVSGAAGRIGRIYAPEFIKQGHEVGVYDVNMSELRRIYKDSGASLYTNNRKLVEGADMVLLFTPVPKTRDVLKEMFMSTKRDILAGNKRYFTPDFILGTASSSKELIAKAELEYAPEGARIVDFHNMHGEGIAPSGQNMLTVPVRDPGGQAERVMQDLFKPMGAMIKHIDSPAKHDMIMGEVQGGNHSVAFSMDTAWELAGVDPDNNDVNNNHLDDAKSLYARRPLGLNLEVYVVTMLWNEHVKRYMQQYNEAFSDIYRKVIDGKREELYRMFEETREHLGREDVKSAREVWESIYGPDFDGVNNSHISLLAWGELAKRRNVRPTNFIEFESPHYTLGRMVTYGAFSGDVRRHVDNAIDNLETRWHDFNFGRAAAIVNQIVDSGDSAALLRHFQRLKEYSNKQDMTRRLDIVARDSLELSRKLKAAKK